MQHKKIFSFFWYFLLSESCHKHHIFMDRILRKYIRTFFYMNAQENFTQNSGYKIRILNEQ